MSLLLTNLSTIGAILAVFGGLALVEAAIPLHPRGPRHRAHLGPNLALTLLTFFTSFFLNAALVLLLLWLDARDLGVLRWLPVGPIMAGVLGVLVLDASWYALHRAMHRVPVLWRIHMVHHSDPVVDVTTAIRQHPGESLLRYATLTLVVAVAGVGLAAFTVYRVWSALNGLFEHANVRLDVRETDTNYGNIFSIFDRGLGTFTPTERGRTVVCGLDGTDDRTQQTTAGLLAMPFAERVPSQPTRASSRAA